MVSPEVVRDLISNFVGIQSTSYSIERCHRTPTTKGSRQGSESERVKPRIIHIAFSSYVAKEEVRRACIAKLKKESNVQRRESVCVRRFFQAYPTVEARKNGGVKAFEGGRQEAFFHLSLKASFQE